MAEGSTSRKCRWVAERLPAYEAGELDADERRRVQEHLATCPLCRAELQRLQQAMGALRVAGEVEPPEGAIEQVLFALNREPAPRVIARRRRLWRLASAGAAATLLVGLFFAAMVLKGYVGAGPRRGSELQMAEPRELYQQMGRVAQPQLPEQPAGAPPGSPLRVSPPPGSPAHPPKAKAAPLTRPSGEPVTEAAKSGGGQPSSRPVAIKPGAIRPGPARKAVPPKHPSAKVAAKARAGVQAAKPPETKGKQVAPGVLGAPGRVEAVPSPAAPPGAGGGPAPSGPRAMSLSEHRAAALPPEGWAVSDDFWQIRIDVPEKLTAGKPANLGVVVAGRAALAGLWLRVKAPDGTWLGDAVEVQALGEGETKTISLPFTPRSPGGQTVIVVVRTEVPQLYTEIPVRVKVAREQPRADGEVSGVFREVPLRQAATALAHQAGADVEVPDEIAQVAIDADFSTPLPLKAALQILAEQVGAKLERTQTGFRFVVEVENDAHNDN